MNTKIKTYYTINYDSVFLVDDTNRKPLKYALKHSIHNLPHNIYPIMGVSCFFKCDLIYQGKKIIYGLTTKPDYDEKVLPECAISLNDYKDFYLRDLFCTSFDKKLGILIKPSSLLKQLFKLENKNNITDNKELIIKKDNNQLNVKLTDTYLNIDCNGIMELIKIDYVSWRDFMTRHSDYFDNINNYPAQNTGYETTIVAKPTQKNLLIINPLEKENKCQSN